MNNESHAWSADDPRRQRQSEKRSAMLAAAMEVFLADGYMGASMDSVAAKAAVGKMTLYRHFKDKQELFVATVHEKCQTRMASTPVDPANDVKQAATALKRFGRIFIETVTQPETLSLYRMLIGEIGRFPELGQLFYDSGPALELSNIERILSGLMSPREARVRAQAFFYITMGNAYHRLQLNCLPKESKDSAFEAQIDAATRMVLAGLEAKPATMRAIAPKTRQAKAHT